MKLGELAVVLILLMATSLLPNVTSMPKVSAQTQATPDAYIGVYGVYQEVDLYKQLVDRVSSYANLLIIGASAISRNATNLSNVCQYAYDRGMSFIIYTDDPRYPTQQWVNASKSLYAGHLLGLYQLDEPGGHQLDQAYKGFWLNVWSATDYQDAANSYVYNVSRWVSVFDNRFEGLQIYASDYALYWYDYQAGFDTVFAEFGWNYSRQINVALCRGAATAQNKDWGVLIAWTYTQPPYIESGPELYNDMVYAYENGAKYVIVYDSNENWTQSILRDEHYSAMQQFWQYAQTHPRSISNVADRVAYVLPDYYAYGFRSPQEDKIWGIWQGDDTSYEISMGVGYLLMLYMNGIDIVYENGVSASAYGYKGIVYWNDTRIYQPQEIYPEISPSFSPTPQPIPTPTSTASPTPTHTVLPTPPPSSASPPPTPTLNASATPTEKPDPTPVAYAIYGSAAVAAGVAVCIVSAALMLRRRRGLGLR